VLSTLPEQGRFAVRFVEWGGLGAGLLPAGDGVESGYSACVGRLSNVFEEWDAGSLGDAPPAAMVAWGLAGRRAEHHDPARDEVAHEAGGTTSVAATFETWAGADTPGSALALTSFVSLVDTPEGVGFERAALALATGDGLQACPELAGSEQAAWPEPGLVGLGGAR
jgi:hypothetical protein